MTGVVKWYSWKHGYGFIHSEEHKQDYFYHVTNVRGSLPEEGNKVEFEIREGRKGLEAVDVRLAG